MDKLVRPDGFVAVEGRYESPVTIPFGDDIGDAIGFPFVSDGNK
jgi:hypothetical protein